MRLYWSTFIYVIIIKTNTKCVTKIRTNFNLNFPLYYASIRGCWRSRKSDASSKESYSQNDRDVENKCGIKIVLWFRETTLISHVMFSFMNNIQLNRIQFIYQAHNA